MLITLKDEGKGKATIFHVDNSWHAVENLSFTYKANGKRQIQVENFSKKKMSR